MRRLTPNIPRRVRTPVVFLSLLLACAAPSYSKEWRGIVPLHSTRSDVERLLGKPSIKRSMRPNDNEYFYDLKDAAAAVWFETTGCEGGSLHAVCGWGWNVPGDTVTSVGVVFKKPRPVASVIDVKGFKEESSCEGLVYYSSESEGLDVETYLGEVLSITYSPKKAEEHLLCPYQPERCRIIERKLDEYGNIGWIDERARLDNVAIELQNAPDTRLGILAYGGRTSRPDEAMKRAARARRYLIRVRNINPWQIVSVVCGYREDLTVELTLPGIGARRIYGVPTVDPSEVKPRARKNLRRR